jgi:hypothetical protein
VKGTYEEFLAALRKRESSGNYSEKNRPGRLGAYQMGEHALADAGFYLTDSTPNKNDWVGTWTKKAKDMGINNEADFLGAKADEDGKPLYETVIIKKGKTEKTIKRIVQDPEKINTAQMAQEDAVKAYHQKVWGYILHYHLDEYVNKVINGIKITESALIAGFHLVGFGLKNYLTQGKEYDITDGNGTHVSEYIELFNDYEVPFKTRTRIQSPELSNPLKQKKSKQLSQGVVPPQDGPNSIKNRWTLMIP